MKPNIKKKTSKGSDYLHISPLPGPTESLPIASPDAGNKMLSKRPSKRNSRAGLEMMWDKSEPYSRKPLPFGKRSMERAKMSHPQSVILAAVNTATA
jgi:hypothetical protein